MLTHEPIRIRKEDVRRAAPSVGKQAHVETIGSVLASDEFKEFFFYSDSLGRDCE